MVDAVTVPVPDLDSGLRFYRDRLGHRLLWRSNPAGQAGLALRQVALTARLRRGIELSVARAEQLRESRQRIVATADAARARLERDIHDGAQQHLVSLAVRLRLVRTITGRDPQRAVVEGIGSTARVITSAGLIMISVFAAFILMPDPVAKLFGVGLAVAVLLDVTLIRMVLVPAAMSLLGHRAWWLPAWLDRRLPSIDLEGAEHEGDDEIAQGDEDEQKELVPA